MKQPQSLKQAPAYKSGASDTITSTSHVGINLGFIFELLALMSHLAAHMAAAGLSIWNNKWDSVYDFNAGGPVSNNWKPLPLAEEIAGIIPEPPAAEYEEVAILPTSSPSADFVVPPVSGRVRKDVGPEEVWSSVRMCVNSAGIFHWESPGASRIPSCCPRSRHSPLLKSAEGGAATGIYQGK